MSALRTMTMVTKRYRQGGTEVTALHEASMTIRAGELAVVRGPSGSGKTTLLNLLLGWETPDDGVVDGVVATADWSAVAVVPQRMGLLEHLTVSENVALPARSTGAVVDPTELLTDLGLADVANRFPAEVSLGEQQRTACARAVVVTPRVLLADEPTSHQDDASAELILARFRRAVTAGAAVLVASHDERAWADADRRWTLTGGRLHAAG